MNYDIRIDKFTTCYYVNNLLHRDNGPAKEYHDGNKEWWLNGNYYGENNHFTNESWKSFIKTLIFA